MLLKVKNLALPLKYTPMGPVLSTENKSIEAIAWLLNSALSRDISDFILSLARGEDIYLRHPLYAVRPTLYNDLEEASRRWYELTGEELGEDVYVLGTTFTGQVVLPRQTLIEIAQKLGQLRAEFPEPPFPWLFRQSPYHLAPATGEEQLVCKLEERATMFKDIMPFGCFVRQTETAPWAGAIPSGLWRDFSAAGLFSEANDALPSEAYFKEKQMWLEVWECPTLLTYHKAALSFLNHFRSQVEQVIPSGADSVPVLSASISQEQLELSYDQEWLMRTTAARRGMVSGEAVLNVNNLSLSLMGTPFGPVLATKNKSLESIAWLVNSAVVHNISHFTESLSRGEDIFLQHPLIAVRPLNSNLSEARTQWRELTGSELGEDVYMVGSRFSDEVVLPRQTLLDLVQTLRQLRAEFPAPPFPWLFRRNPYEMAPADGEQELVCELEKRAAASQQSPAQSMPCQKAFLRELSEAGIFSEANDALPSEAYFNQKKHYLERWECPTLLTYLQAALKFLNHFRSQTAPAMRSCALPVPVLSIELSESLLSFPYMPSESGEGS